jgi:hypothetical protein
LALDFSNSIPVSTRGRRADILGSGGVTTVETSTLGTGNSKWVKPKTYESWKKPV